MNTNQHARMMRQIENHGRALLAAFPDCAERDPVKLCKRLLRRERFCRQVAVDYNNGVCTLEAAEKATDANFAAVRKLLGKRGPAIFRNWDSRGCFFKIDDKEAATCPGIYRDMGGYGLIAPTFGGN